MRNVSASGRAKKAAEENRTGGDPMPSSYGGRVLAGHAARMLTAMWVFPLVAAGVAFVFSAVLFKQFAARRRPYLLVWGIALAMYGVASAAVVVGVLNGWTSFWFELYWAFGAVLNVPFLAGGEIQLLARNRTVDRSSTSS